MLDPLTFRIIGVLLVVIGATAMGFGYYDAIPQSLPGAPRSYMVGGAIAAALGAILIVFSAFFRRGRHGLNSRPHRRTGKPSAIRRLAMFWGGIFLVIISPLVGVIPGPGGIIVFAAGFGLMLRGSRWVKKRYARFKRKNPKKGEWVDFGLQRASYKRRQARLKAEARAGEDPDNQADARELEPGYKN